MSNSQLCRSQLFCFTFAGGTASFFDQIEQDLSGSGIACVKLEYAGHGERHREPLYNDFSALADDMFEQFRASYYSVYDSSSSNSDSGSSDSSGLDSSNSNNYSDYSDYSDYSLFGYSMGTITLVEVLRRLLMPLGSSTLPAPKHVFLAAHEPHTHKELLSFNPDELDSWVKERTLKFGTVPEKLINNKTFWRMYLPLYRADYALLAGYNFENLNLHTDIPATIFYSEADTPLKEMKLWEKYFTGRVDYHCYEGQHFFIKEHHAEMANVIMRELRVDEGDEGAEGAECE